MIQATVPAGGRGVHTDDTSLMIGTYIFSPSVASPAEYLTIHRYLSPKLKLYSCEIHTSVRRYALFCLALHFMPKVLGPVWLTSGSRMHHTNLAPRYIHIRLECHSDGGPFGTKMPSDTHSERVECTHTNRECVKKVYSSRVSVTPFTWTPLKPGIRTTKPSQNVLFSPPH